LGTTHNLYQNPDPTNFHNDPYTVTNLSVNKDQLLAKADDKGYCNFFVFPQKDESKEKDRAHADYFVTDGVSTKENPVEVNYIGKAWNVNHQQSQKIEKEYVGNAIMQNNGGFESYKLFLDSKKVADIINKEKEPKNLYVNITATKDDPNKFSAYTINTKEDKYNAMTVALDKGKLLNATPFQNKNGENVIALDLNFRKDESIKADMANLNVKHWDKETGESTFVGKGWTRENFYWLEPSMNQDMKKASEFNFEKGDYACFLEGNLNVHGKVESIDGDKAKVKLDVPVDGTTSWTVKTKDLFPSSELSNTRFVKQMQEKGNDKSENKTETKGKSTGKSASTGNKKKASVKANTNAAKAQAKGKSKGKEMSM
jgi:hypothetical protein